MDLGWIWGGSGRQVSEFGVDLGVDLGGIWGGFERPVPEFGVNLE